MYLKVLLTIVALMSVVGLSSCTGEKAETSTRDQVAASPPGKAAGPGHSAPQDDQSSVDQTPGTKKGLPPEPIPVKQEGSEVILDPSAVSWSALDIDGNVHSSSEWIGRQPVVINFWGTWCPPCRREIPDLVKAYEEFKPRGVEIISFAMRDTPGQVRDYATRANMKWVMLMGGDEKMLADYRFSGGVPTSIFLDRTGKEVGRFVGPRNLEIFRQAFERIL